MLHQQDLHVVFHSYAVTILLAAFLNKHIYTSVPQWHPKPCLIYLLPYPHPQEWIKIFIILLPPQWTLYNPCSKNKIFQNHHPTTVHTHLGGKNGNVHSCQQKSNGLKFSKSQTRSDVRYNCHHNSSRFTFPIFAHSFRFSVLHPLQSITPRIY